MQMLTTEAAQAEIINKDFTSPETVLPLPSFGRSLQHLQQQTFWWWSIQSHPCICSYDTSLDWDTHRASEILITHQTVSVEEGTSNPVLLDG